MPRSRTRSASTINGPFLGSDALAEGVLSKRQLYSPLFTRLFHGVHLPRAIPITHELRCQAAALAVPSEAVLTGASAAAVFGVELVEPHAPVELVVPEEAKFRVQGGMDLRRTTLDIDSEPWHGIRLARPLRMAMDMLTNVRLHRSLPRLVAMLDVLLRSELVDAAALGRLLDNSHDHGIVRARRALELADARAESIPESEMRVWLVMGGCQVTPQLAVYAGDAFLARLDLGIEEYKLAIEYDGQWHDAPAQQAHDFQRRQALAEAGWEVVVVRKEDLYGDPRAMVETVRGRIRRRLPVG